MGSTVLPLFPVENTLLKGLLAKVILLLTKMRRDVSQWGSHSESLM